jgi:hypothetical protein
MASATDLIPIDPSLDDNGRFRALAGFLEGDNAKPVPLSVKTPFSPEMSSELYDRSFSADASLAAGGIFSAQGQAAGQTLIWDMRLGNTALIPAGPLKDDNRVLATFWGVALRVALLLQTQDASASVSIEAVTAQVQLGRAQAQYQVTGLGFDNDMLAPLLRGMPLFGALDFQAYAKLIGAFRDLSDKVFNGKSQTLQALPIAVALLDELPTPAMLASARSYRYAMLKIAGGLMLKDARARAGTEVDQAVVLRVYQSTLGGDGSGPVSAAQAAAARAWSEL